MSTLTLTALIVLALDTGAIGATVLALVHTWLGVRTHGRHRRPGVLAYRTVVLGSRPGALPPVDRDLTPRYPALWDQPTACLAAAVDPWAGREDADSILALAA
jgi:hypothetical protein